MLQSCTTSKQRNTVIIKCLVINFFCKNFFATPNSKYTIAILRIVTIEKPELTFLLTLFFSCAWTAAFFSIRPSKEIIHV